ncbi:PTS lactose transporter subunit IIC, partial [Enterobacter hormaechei]
AVTTGVFIPWTLPPVISGFIVTGHLSGSVMQLINLLIGAMLYLPFMRIVDKQYRAAELTTATQTDTTLAKQE